MTLRMEPTALLLHESVSRRCELPWCDIVGAEVVDDGPGAIVTSALRQAGCCGRGSTDASPFLKLKRTRVALGSIAEAREAVAEIRRRAAGPPPARITLVVNPNSGGREGVRILEQVVQPMLQAAGWPTAAVVTEHGAHLRELGRAAVAEVRGAMAASEEPQTRLVIIIGGDGTVGEFVNALLRCCCEPVAAGVEPSTAAPQAAAAALLAAVFSSLRICAIPCGTQNALARGLRTVHPVHALMCVLRGRLRPLDAFLARSGSGEVRLGFCGFAWGVPGAIAGSSEAYRWLGRARYAFLKARHGVPVGLGLATYSASVTWTPAVPSSSTSQRGTGAGGGAAEPPGAILAGQADGSPEYTASSRLRRGGTGATTPRTATAAEAPLGRHSATPDSGSPAARLSHTKVELTACVRRCGACRGAAEAGSLERQRASVTLLIQACLPAPAPAALLSGVESSPASTSLCAAAAHSPATSLATLTASVSPAASEVDLAAAAFPRAAATATSADSGLRDISSPSVSHAIRLSVQSCGVVIHAVSESRLLAIVTRDPVEIAGAGHTTLPQSVNRDEGG